MYMYKQNLACPIGWGNRIHRLHPCRRIRSPPNECPRYDTKQSDGEASAIPDFGGIQITPSLPSLPSSIWPEELAPDRILSMGQIKLNYVLMIN